MDLTVSDANADGTSLAVEAEVEVLGKVATLGQFVIKREAQEIVKQFARNIGRELHPAPAGS